MSTCVSCKKGDISDDRIVSCGVCGDIFCHPCSKLLPTELKVIQLKSPTTLIFYCQSCKAEIQKPAMMQVKLLKEQIQLLTNIIKDKEVIIEDKCKIISHLEESAKTRKLPKKLGSAGGEVSGTSKLVGPHNPAPGAFTTAVKSNKPNSGNNPDSRDRVNALRVLENKQRAVMNEIINLQKEDSNSSLVHSHTVQSAANGGESSWKTMTYKKKKNRTILGANTGELSIAAVESRRSIFVSRLSPDTTSERIRKHLEDNNIKPLEVEKLGIKSKDIAAFKLVVQQSDEKQATKSELWPKYTIIRPFRQPRAFLHGSSQSNLTT